MAVKMVFDYQNAKNILVQSMENDARPIVILEASASDRELLNIELFSQAPQSIRLTFSDFLMEYVYSISKQSELLDYSYIVVDCVEKLRGMSGTQKILSTFIDNMSHNGVSVIFMGDTVFHDMCEIVHIIGSKIQYMMKIEAERN